MIETAHIVRMLEEAEVLAVLAQEVDAQHGVEGQEQTIPARHGRATTWTALERAANLARHAAAELEDELLRARQGWPIV